MSTEVKVGFVPLTDSAPLVVAEKLGYFEKLGLRVSLYPQNSWATLRDKLQMGALDAAQLLAPMPIASSLGLGGAKVQMKVPLILSQNGNAITISNALFDEVLDSNGLLELPFPLPAKCIANVVAKRARQGLPKLKFATVFPYSCHHYQLNDWLNQADLSGKVDVITIPPSAMTDCLSSGLIDGFCVGGPWNAKSVRDNDGVTVLTSYHIWQDQTEKVLAVTKQFFEQETQTVIKLSAGLLGACSWLQSQANRFEAARWLAQSSYLNEPLDVIAPSLLGSCITKYDSAPEQVPQYNRFFGSEPSSVNKPSLQNQEWLIRKMREAKQIPEDEIAMSDVFDKRYFEETVMLFQGSFTSLKN
ncbi:CmpA/NrtA family ABC transporter substrate-binding protein [Alteromonas sp. W364]|uniref:CmpA/NrtA family ABC transporter substrate-binding protein n=1 Tax=Alteromonas sp. W364 TaxID=3075610 RepID=UPI002887C2D7|nr:CmpA/NrtA family ABC transporter substrate-binding protein [Alteromonas sp. W364]MDT0627889.1 CmpA/NrtA family ABC transporter substrate-binding protein [Alteromonas sp. W364]